MLFKTCEGGGPRERCTTDLVNGFVEARHGLLVIGATCSLSRYVHVHPRFRDSHVRGDQAHVGKACRHHHRRHFSLTQRTNRRRRTDDSGDMGAPSQGSGDTGVKC